MYVKLKDLENIGNCWTKKAKSPRINVECNEKFKIRRENIEEVEKFTYLGSEITRQCK
jgi:hypothetical protein